MNMTVVGRIALTALTVTWVTLFLPPSAGAAQVTIGPSHDNSIFEDGADRSCGVGPLFCGQTGRFGVRRVVITFDVAGSIPQGSIVTSVELGVTVELAGPVAQTTDIYSLHRLLADWGEQASECSNGVGALAEVGDATWTHRHYPTDAWSQAGGDFNALPSGSVAMATLGLATFASQAGMVADVQSWLDQPSGNSGWIIIGNEAIARTARELDSRESAFPPSLHIEFTPPSVSPPAVPDGVTGSPVILSKLSADGADLGVSWDATLCSGGVDHHIVYGTRAGFPAAPLDSYTLEGSACALGASSPYVWNGSPDPAVVDPGTRLIWILVLANDGATTEGSWGHDSLLQERNGIGVDGSSNQCGIVDKSVTNTCGIGFQR
jgi:hypothetical protein